MTHMQGLGIATMFNGILLTELYIISGNSAALLIISGIISVIVGEFILIFSCKGKD